MSLDRVEIIAANIDASDEIKNVNNCINQLRKELVQVLTNGTNDLYELLIHFSLKEAQEKLKLVLDGPLMQRIHELSIQYNIIYINDTFDKKNLPENKICIHLKKDENQSPLYLFVGFNSLFNSSDCLIDLIDVNRQSELVKKNNLTYLKNVEEIEKHFKQIKKEITNNTEKEKLTELVSEFNQKWPSVTMTLEINTSKKIAILKANDNYNLISLKSTATYRPALLQESFAHFLWNQSKLQNKQDDKNTSTNLLQNKFEK